MPPKRFPNSDKVIEAAAYLFQRDGYQNTTIDDIARQAGIAKPTIYQYVEGKSSLLEQIVAEVLDHLADDQRRAIESSDDPEEQLRNLIRSHVLLVAEMRTHYRIFLGEEKQLPRASRRRFDASARKVADELRQLIQRCIDVGVFRPGVDAEIASFLIQGAVVSTTRWYDPTGPLDPDALADQVLALVEGYGTHPGARGGGQARRPSRRGADRTNSTPRARDTGRKAPRTKTP